MVKRKMTVAKLKEKKLRKKRQKVTKIAVPKPEQGVRRFERGVRDILRALKKGKGFERQRLAKRIADENKMVEKRNKKTAKQSRKKPAKSKETGEKEEAASETAAAATAEKSEKLQRLEREVLVLKTLDLELSARVHLAHAVLRIKELAEAPGPLPAHVQAIIDLPPVKRRGQGDASDIHNVSSALFNRIHVRDSVAKAMNGICLVFCVPIPERYQRAQMSGKERQFIRSGMKDEQELDDELDIIDDVSDDDDDTSEDEDEDDAEAEGGKEKKSGKGESDDEAAEEKALMQRFEARLGGSSDDDDSDEEEDLETLRSKYQEALAAPPPDTESEEEETDEDDLAEEEDEGATAAFYIDETPTSNAKDGAFSSEDDSDDSDDSEENEPPRKRLATSSAKSMISAGDSRFLPTLMGGYVSDGGESAESDDAAATRMLTQRKNRRGQRARQAIWEQKYKEQARHLQEAQKKSKGKDIKWDAKRGAVEAGEGPRWLRRKQGKLGGGGGGGGSAGAGDSKAAGGDSKGSNQNSKPASNEPLHPSWEAAKKAKEKTQTAAFAGKKIVFD